MTFRQLRDLWLKQNKDIALMPFVRDCCRNCHRLAPQHADGKKCLYEPTAYTPYGNEIAAKMLDTLLRSPTFEKDIWDKELPE